MTQRTIHHYEAIGNVRGPCGHKHQTPDAAERCAEKDRRACKRLSANSYSDRRPAAVDSYGYTILKVIA